MGKKLVTFDYFRKQYALTREDQTMKIAKRKCNKKNIN
jgi:hypothetical protein